MPRYQQLEQQLEVLISDGALPAGTVLPAERQLAESLGLSRATVQRAYHYSCTWRWRSNYLLI